MGVTTNFLEVKKLLEEFGQRDAFDIGLAATRRVASRVRTRVRQYAPVKKGTLKKSIRSKTIVDRRLMTYSVRVYNSIGYYNALLYGGRAAHKRRGRKGGNWFPVAAQTIRNPAGNWFDKAMANHQAEFIALMTEKLRSEMRKSAGRIYKKTVATSARIARKG